MARPHERSLLPVSKLTGAVLCISLAAVVLVGVLGGFGGVGNATSAAGSRLQEAVGTRSPDLYPQAAAVAVDGNPLPDFSLYVKPSSPVSAGGHSSNRITVTSIHQFTGRVRLAVRALPPAGGRRSYRVRSSPATRPSHVYRYLPTRSQAGIHSRSPAKATTA